MANEWRQKKWISVVFQSQIIRLNSRHVLLTFHSMALFKIKISSDAAQGRDLRIKGKVCYPFDHGDHLVVWSNIWCKFNLYKTVL